MRGQGTASAYVGQGFADVDDESVREHLPLVRKVARRLAHRLPPHVEIDELVSWGLGGLLEAMQRFDSEQQASFETYAHLRIRGAILDRLRALDPQGRGVRRRQRKIETAYRDVERRNGRAATDEEVAEALGVDVAKLGEMLAEVGTRGIGGFEEWGNAPPPPEELASHAHADPSNVLLGLERLQLVADAIEGLPEKEKLVISLYYKEGITMREVGGVLNVTESRVSQIHTRAMLRLRSRLSREFEELRR